MAVYIAVGFVAVVIGFVLFMFNFGFPRLYRSGKPLNTREAIENGKELFRQGGRAVAVVAHPDDAEYYCGGTLAKLARSGCEIIVVVCTTETGEEGKLRKEEQWRAASVLGYRRVVFLDYPDRSLKVSDKLVGQLADVYGREKPRILFTFDSLKEGKWYHHPDHKAAGRAALEAAESHGFSAIYLFHSGSPNTWAEFSKGILELKVKAYLQHESQRPLGLPLAGNHIRRAAESEGSTVGLKYAEVFRRL